MEKEEENCEISHDKMNLNIIILKYVSLGI